MKVLHVIWDLGQGGAQTYLLNLLRWQASDKALEPSLVVLSERGPLSEQFEKLVPTEYFGMTGGTSIVRATEVLRHIRRRKPCLIHSHSNNLLFISMLHFTTVPVVYTEHGGGLLGGRRQDLFIYRYLFRPITRWIAISKLMSEVMQDASPSRTLPVDLVYNGVNVKEIEGAAVHNEYPEDERFVNATHRIGIVARLHRQKGVDLFLRAAALITAEARDTVFLVVGDGELRPGLESLTRELGIADNTAFLGYRTDAIEIMKSFDVFLFTSEFEPFGLVVAEAMAAKVPVVAVHTEGAIPEIIEDQHDGIIVNSREPEQVCRAVMSLLRNPARAEELAQNACAKIHEHLSIESNAMAVKSVYEKALLSQ